MNYGLGGTSARTRKQHLLNSKSSEVCKSAEDTIGTRNYKCECCEVSAIQATQEHAGNWNLRWPAYLQMRREQKLDGLAVHKVLDAILLVFAKHTTSIMSVLVLPISMPAIAKKACVSCMHSGRNTKSSHLSTRHAHTAWCLSMLWTSRYIVAAIRRTH